jgi:hypothetical protein
MPDHQLALARQVDEDLSNDFSRLPYLRGIASRSSFLRDSLRVTLIRRYYSVCRSWAQLNSPLTNTQSSPIWLQKTLRRYLDRIDPNKDYWWVLEGMRPTTLRDTGKETDAQVIATVARLLIWSGCVGLEGIYEGAISSDDSQLWERCCRANEIYFLSLPCTEQRLRLGVPRSTMDSRPWMSLPACIHDRELQSAGYCEESVLFYGTLRVVTFLQSFGTQFSIDLSHSHHSCSFAEEVVHLFGPC